jgi:hypothetical protein
MSLDGGTGAHLMPAREKQSVEQLDFLRGLAIGLMTTNHVGTRFLDQILQATSPITILTGEALPAALTLAAIGIVLTLSVILSRPLTTDVSRGISTTASIAASVALSLIVALCAGNCLFPFQQPTPKFAAFVVGQLAITTLLAIRNKRASVTSSQCRYSAAS